MVLPMTRKRQTLSFLWCASFIRAFCHSLIAIINPQPNQIQVITWHFHLWFVVTTKLGEGEIYKLYIDLNTRFKFGAFEDYKVLLCVKHFSITMHWMIDWYMGIEHLAFNVNHQHIWPTHSNLQSSEVFYVTKEVYVVIITQVEVECANLF
jgi:hypothetical protein